MLIPKITIISYIFECSQLSIVISKVILSNTIVVTHNVTYVVSQNETFAKIEPTQCVVHI